MFWVGFGGQEEAEGESRGAKAPDNINLDFNRSSLGLNIPRCWKPEDRKYAGATWEISPCFILKLPSDRSISVVGLCALILPSGNCMRFMNVKFSVTASLAHNLVLGRGVHNILKYMPEFDPDAPCKTWGTAGTTMINLYGSCDETRAFDGKN
ncbi:hypothetical protein B0H19DRAFT_1256127 [Mycena capillaripes]|nr:hypothetical protein B0H19DRAFT_1256127 [Mycena capillaripes]